MKHLMIITAIVMLNAGCSMTMGNFEPNTHFAYPNSNVRPLGHVSVSVKEGSFFTSPSLTKEKALKLLNDGLAQQPGADMIVNYRLDTTYTFYPIIPYTVQEIKLEGTAAKMEVGEQNISGHNEASAPPPPPQKSPRTTRKK